MSGSSYCGLGLALNAKKPATPARRVALDLHPNHHSNTVTMYRINTNIYEFLKYPVESAAFYPSHEATVSFCLRCRRILYLCIVCKEKR